MRGGVLNRCIRFCSSREDYEKVGDVPKVVLASQPSLQAGFARQLAVEFMEDEKNLIILTEVPKARNEIRDLELQKLCLQDGTLAHELLKTAEGSASKQIHVRMSKR